jgi:TonB-dependent SusC/RagA subfamily outer membrane receptor
MVFLLWELKFDKLLRYRINNGIKDASATSIYGSRGANGVILITTKTGKAGASYIQVETKLGYNVALLPRYNTVISR